MNLDKFKTPLAIRETNSKCYYNRQEERSQECLTYYHNNAEAIRARRRERVVCPRCFIEVGRGSWCQHKKICKLIPEEDRKGLKPLTRI